MIRRPLFDDNKNDVVVDKKTQVSSSVCWDSVTRQKKCLWYKTSALMDHCDGESDYTRHSHLDHDYILL